MALFPVSVLGPTRIVINVYAPNLWLMAIEFPAYINSNLYEFSQAASFMALSPNSNVGDRSTPVIGSRYFSTSFPQIMQIILLPAVINVFESVIGTQQLYFRPFGPFLTTLSGMPVEMLLAPLPITVIIYGLS